MMEANVLRSIFAITVALVVLAANQANAGGYYYGGYRGYYGGGYGYYGPHPYRGYYGYGGYYGPRAYYGPYGYYGPAYNVRPYYGPVPILSTLFGPGPRCQHRVPVMNYQGEVRGGWINGC